MKQITVVGMGLGEQMMTPEAREAIDRAEIILGAPRMLESCRHMDKTTYPYYLPNDVAALIDKENAQAFAVLVSGDVGFYSAATGLVEVLGDHDLRFIPGISTVNAFFAKLKLPWQEAAFCSAHGRDANVVDVVRRHRLTFCLTGNNVKDVASALCEAGFANIKTYVGEDLGTDRERIFEMLTEALTDYECPSLTVLLLINESYDNRTPTGLPDECFARLVGIPMTKSETRAVIMSKLNLYPESICWDVGAGSGSVTVEMALSAWRGRVYAVERREDALPLIVKNCAQFHVGNVTVVNGEAPAALEAIPAPDAVFIGGSGGQLDEIIRLALNKNPSARIVMSAVTIETVSAGLDAFKKAGLQVEIVQISVARGKKAGNLHLMEAQNPITILSAGGIA